MQVLDEVITEYLPGVPVTLHESSGLLSNRLLCSTGACLPWEGRPTSRVPPLQPSQCFRKMK